MTTCPCCGEEFDGDLFGGCAACGARAVGPPLARPERMLPGYGYALAAAGAGALAVVTFAAAFGSALWEAESLSLEWPALVRAAETAAWRLKWTALPASFALAVLCARACKRVRREPARHAGLGLARAGFALTALTALMLASLVGVTIPERLRMRELARRAAENAELYAADLALARYKQRFGTYPATLQDLRRLEDADGSIARLLASAGEGEYKPETDLASLSAGRAKSKGRRRASALRGRANSDDSLGAGIVLTNYALALPGRDKLLGTDDDLRIRDGRIGGGAVGSATRARASANARGN